MRKNLGIALLALFVAVDIVLVVLALRHTSGSPHSDSSPHARSPAVQVSPAQSSSPSPVDVTQAPAGPFSLATTSTGVVVRATKGSCSTGDAPTVEVSAKQGRRLTQSTVGGLSQTLAVATASGSLTIIGLDQDCNTATFHSDDDGAHWNVVANAPAAWHVLPALRKQVVVTPGGRRRTPCSPRDLAPVDNRAARLLCRDGRIEGTGDGGDTWITLGNLRGAVDVSFEGVGDGVAVATQSDCPAAFMRTVDGGTSWSEVSCLKGGQPQAVAESGGVTVAQAGQRLQLSTDGGSSWRRLAR